MEKKLMNVLKLTVFSFVNIESYILDSFWSGVEVKLSRFWRLVAKDEKMPVDFWYYQVDWKLFFVLIKTGFHVTIQTIILNPRDNDNFETFRDGLLFGQASKIYSVRALIPCSFSKTKVRDESHAKNSHIR